MTSSATQPQIPCCCRSSSCSAFLAHRDEVEELLEKNSLAGQLGQNLLQRHEAYVAEAQQDRKRMMTTIDTLSRQNTELEAQNKRTIEENRTLLDELEALNTAVKDSESKVSRLTSVLSSTEQELERVNGLAARTAQLQTQLSQLEDDLEIANGLVSTTKDENRTAILHWQEAERTVAKLTGQIDRIEEEAKAERDRHEDVLARVERRKTVELELLRKRPKDTTTSNGSAVVNHFVKDILQDNANLQLGIVELRELLNKSNDEVERLREQIVLGSPRLDGTGERSGSQTPTLGAELAGATGRTELHVHHHYHAPNPANAENKGPRHPLTRRGRKRRISSRTHTPRSSISLGRPSSPSSTSAILSQTSVTIPKNQRWSMQSNQTGFTSSSSLPSSPYADSIFDRVFPDTATDASRPSSPESSAAFSPKTGPEFGTYDVRNLNRTVSEGSAPRLSQPPFARGSVSAGKQPLRDPTSYYDIEPVQSVHATILEDIEEMEASQHLPAPLSSSPNRLSSSAQPDSPLKFRSPAYVAPALRRSTSHESLISISGMDIHTLKSRPSQLLLGKYVATPTASVTAATSTTNAIISEASATAPRPTLSAASQRTPSHSYLSSIAATSQRTVSRKTSTPSLGGRVGGWVRSKWGIGATSSNAAGAESDTASNASATPPATSAGTANGSALSTTPATAKLSSVPIPSIAEMTTPRISSSNLSVSPQMQPVFRTFGVNQPGPIFGFPLEKKLERKVVVKGLNVDALRDGLEGD